MKTKASLTSGDDLKPIAVKSPLTPVKTVQSGTKRGRSAKSGKSGGSEAKSTSRARQGSAKSRQLQKSAQSPSPKGKQMGKSMTLTPPKKLSL